MFELGKFYNPNFYFFLGHVPKMAAGSIGPDAMNMMRLKQYSDMQKRLNKRATLRAAKYDLNAYGIQGDIQSQSLVKDKNDNKMDNHSDHHFPAVLVSASTISECDLSVCEHEVTCWCILLKPLTRN